MRGAWTRIGAFVSLLAFGCGGTGTEQELAPQDVVLGAGDLFGTESPLGRTTSETVLLRKAADGVAALGPKPGVHLVSPVFGRTVTFSSPAVAWTIGSTDQGEHVLLRSDDFGTSWAVQARLPDVATGVLDLHVDASTTGVLTVWVAVLTGREALPEGPEVWSRPLDRDAAWVKHDLGPTRGCCRGARFARRAGRLELLRNDSFCLLPEGQTVLQTIAGGSGAMRIDALDGFADYRAIGDQGWIIGPRRDDASGGAARSPTILHLEGHAAPRIADIREMQGGSVAAFDFVDELHGSICGNESSSRSLVCFFTDDGGGSWQRSTLPDGLAARFGVLDVARTIDGGGLALLGDGFRVAALTTSDDGRSWEETPLPPLAGRTRFRRLVHSSAAPDALDGEMRVPEIPRPTPSSSLRPGPAPEAGPLAIVVGDSTARGPGIAGVALRSTDFGASWEDVLVVPGGSLSGVAMVDSHAGWVVGAGRVLRTDDGGTTFTDQSGGVVLPDRLLDVRAVTAADPARAVIVAQIERTDPPHEETEALLFTTDGGESWSLAARASDLVPFVDRIEGDPCLTRTGHGIVSVESDVFLTSNGGRSWTPGPRFEWFLEDEGSTSSGGGFASPLFVCSGESDLWIVVSGQDPRGDALWHSPDGGASWENLTKSVGRIPDYPNSASFVATGAGWLVNASDTDTSLLRTEDGGASWSDLPSPLLSNDRGGPAELPEAMAFADERVGLMVLTGFGANGFADRHPVLATTDGGVTWRRSELPEGFHPLALSFVP